MPSWKSESRRRRWHPLGLIKLYPSIYVTLAQGRDDATLYLTAVRMLFSIVALIVPTMLMGATLPVLSRFITHQPERLRRHLSFLYGVNTFGAVVGALAAGFLLLRLFPVSVTLYLAVATNAVIGFVCLVLPETTTPAAASPAITPAPSPPSNSPEREVGFERLPFGLVLWGIGVSGFCALGYEVLWTRILTLATGASVYGFTIILVAFLTGIALGSAACGLLARTAGAAMTTRRIVTWFGVTQVAIGITALLVTVYLRDIPAQAVRIQSLVSGAGLEAFRTRIWASFSLAFLYMVVPALFMGAAFPLAGEAVARHRRAVGRAVGNVLAANTVGAVLGAATSGLVLIHFFGIETSLQLLTVLNLGLGVLVLAHLQPQRWLPACRDDADSGASGHSDGASGRGQDVGPELPRHLPQQPA